jgi:hypothetical protein
MECGRYVGSAVAEQMQPLLLGYRDWDYCFHDTHGGGSATACSAGLPRQ